MNGEGARLGDDRYYDVESVLERDWATTVLRHTTHTPRTIARHLANSRAELQLWGDEAMSVVRSAPLLARHYAGNR